MLTDFFGEMIECSVSNMINPVLICFAMFAKRIYKSSLII